ncbi:hypothetical protein D3C84_632180 [compost metagenome]
MQGPELYCALGRAQLGGESSFAVFVLGSPWGFTIVLEDAGADPVGTGIKFDSEQANSIEPHADGTFGVTGLKAQHKTLCPFLSLGLGSTVLTEVAVHVEVTHVQIGLAVADKISRRLRRDTHCGGKTRQCEEWSRTMYAHKSLFS